MCPRAGGGDPDWTPRRDLGWPGTGTGLVPGGRVPRVSRQPPFQELPLVRSVPFVTLIVTPAANGGLALATY